MTKKISDSVARIVLHITKKIVYIFLQSYNVPWQYYKLCTSAIYYIHVLHVPDAATLSRFSDNHDKTLTFGRK